MAKNKRCVVVGGGGFIGTYLCKELLAAGYDVTSYSRSPNSYFSHFPKDKFKSVVGLTGDIAKLSQVLKGADFVFLLNSSSSPIASEGNPFTDLEEGVKETLDILSASVENNVTQVIFTSSGGSVYGEAGSEPHSERDAPYPTSPYAISKLAIEYYLNYFFVKYGLESTIFRISNVYGCGQSPNKKQGIIPIYVTHALEGLPIVVYGDGSMVRDYIYVNDVAHIIAHNFEKLDKNGSIYNLGSGVGMSVNEIIDAIEDISGTQLSKSYIPTPSTFVQKSVLDTRKLTSQMSSYELTPFRDGLRNTWESMKEHLSEA